MNASALTATGCLKLFLWQRQCLSGSISCQKNTTAQSPGLIKFLTKNLIRSVMKVLPACGSSACGNAVMQASASNSSAAIQRQLLLHTASLTTILLQTLAVGKRSTICEEDAGCAAFVLQATWFLTTRAWTENGYMNILIILLPGKTARSPTIHSLVKT